MRGILQDQVDLLRVKEVPIHRQDVLVPQMAANLDLPLKLFLHPVLNELLLVQYLDGHDEL